MRKTLLPIHDVARKLEIPDQYFEQVGPLTAKVSLELLADPGLKRRGKLILVTATNPTTSGEGKTVTAIGLTQGLALIGKRVVITSREPSLGPVFGMKGGAAGGGLSQIEPSEKINLHFTGDFHAISSAHNLLAALIDAGERWLGLTRLQLAVFVDNRRAFALYERFGFAIEGTHRGYAFRDGALVDAHSMARVWRGGGSS